MKEANIENIGEWLESLGFQLLSLHFTDKEDTFKFWHKKDFEVHACVKVHKNTNEIPDATCTSISFKRHIRKLGEYLEIKFDTGMNSSEVFQTEKFLERYDKFCYIISRL